jgi:hypothetical protein
MTGGSGAGGSPAREVLLWSVGGLLASLFVWTLL